MLTDNVSLPAVPLVCRSCVLLAGGPARAMRWAPRPPRHLPDPQWQCRPVAASLRLARHRDMHRDGQNAKTIFDDERFAVSHCMHVFMIEELLREISLWLLIRSRATRRSQHLNVLEAPRASRGAQRLKCEGCDPNRLGAHSVCGRRTCTSAHANSASLLVAHSQAGI